MATSSKKYREPSQRDQMGHVSFRGLHSFGAIAWSIQCALLPIVIWNFSCSSVGSCSGRVGYCSSIQYKPVHCKPLISKILQVWLDRGVIAWRITSAKLLVPLHTFSTRLFMTMRKLITVSLLLALLSTASTYAKEHLIHRHPLDAFA